MSLFITGSTGFLGTGILHLLEKKKYKNAIYLLIRTKKISAMERFNIIKKDFPLLDLHLIEHDLFNISNLLLHVDYIINCAASIDFNLELSEATIQNVDGLLELIKFSKNNNIKNFIHISTAYVSEHSNIAEEKFINMKALGDINELYAKIKSNKITFSEILSKKFFPNTYCFTKCLAEKFIEEDIKNNRIFYQIIRPSIITNAESVPYPGWFKGNGATIGIHKLIHSNLLNVLICDKNTKLDYIPVDHVATNIYTSLKSKNRNIRKIKYKIKHITSYFTPSVEETIIHLNNNGLNIQMFDNKNVIYYYYKYYNLLKITFLIILNYLLSFIYKEKKYTTKKMINIFNIVNSLQETYNFFLNNSYYFKNSNKNNNKNSNIKLNYYNTMINAIKKH